MSRRRTESRRRAAASGLLLGALWLVAPPAGAPDEPRPNLLLRAAQRGYVAVPPPGWKAFPERLRAAGYFTANSGKTDYQMSTRLGGVWGGPFTTRW